MPSANENSEHLTFQEVAKILFTKSSSASRSKNTSISSTMNVDRIPEFNDALQIDDGDHNAWLMDLYQDTPKYPSLNEINFPSPNSDVYQQYCVLLKKFDELNINGSNDGQIFFSLRFNLINKSKYDSSCDSSGFIQRLKIALERIAYLIEKLPKNSGDRQKTLMLLKYHLNRHEFALSSIQEVLDILQKEEKLVDRVLADFRRKIVLKFARKHIKNKNIRRMHEDFIYDSFLLCARKKKLHPAQYSEDAKNDDDFSKFLDITKPELYLSDKIYQEFMEYFEREYSLKNVIDELEGAVKQELLQLNITRDGLITLNSQKDVEAVLNKWLPGLSACIKAHDTELEVSSEELKIFFLVSLFNTDQVHASIIKSLAQSEMSNSFVIEIGISYYAYINFGELNSIFFGDLNSLFRYAIDNDNQMLFKYIIEIQTEFSGLKRLLEWNGNENLKKFAVSSNFTSQMNALLTFVIEQYPDNLDDLANTCLTVFGDQNILLGKAFDEKDHSTPDNIYKLYRNFKLFIKLVVCNREALVGFINNNPDHLEKLIRHVATYYPDGAVEFAASVFGVANSFIESRSQLEFKLIDAAKKLNVENNFFSNSFIDYFLSQIIKRDSGCVIGEEYQLQQYFSQDDIFNLFINNIKCTLPKFEQVNLFTKLLSQQLKFFLIDMIKDNEPSPQLVSIIKRFINVIHDFDSDLINKLPDKINVNQTISVDRGFKRTNFFIEFCCRKNMIKVKLGNWKRDYASRKSTLKYVDYHPYESKKLFSSLEVKGSFSINFLLDYFARQYQLPIREKLLSKITQAFQLQCLEVCLLVDEYFNREKYVLQYPNGIDKYLHDLLAKINDYISAVKNEFSISSEDSKRKKINAMYLLGCSVIGFVSGVVDKAEILACISSIRMNDTIASGTSSRVVKLLEEFTFVFSHFNEHDFLINLKSILNRTKLNIYKITNQSFFSCVFSNSKDVEIQKFEVLCDTISKELMHCLKTQSVDVSTFLKNITSLIKNESIWTSYTLEVKHHFDFAYVVLSKGDNRRHQFLNIQEDDFQTATVLNGEVLSIETLRHSPLVQNNIHDDISLKFFDSDSKQRQNDDEYEDSNQTYKQINLVHPLLGHVLQDQILSSHQTLCNSIDNLLRCEIVPESAAASLGVR